MSDSEEEFLQEVEHICAKPGLYIGRPDFYAVVVFLGGLIMGLTKAGKLTSYPFGGLLTLLEHQDGFSHPAWGWWRHYLHDKKTDKMAIQDLPRFLREALAVPNARIEELHATRPSNYQPPESPHTKKYDS